MPKNSASTIGKSLGGTGWKGPTNRKLVGDHPSDKKNKKPRTTPLVDFWKRFTQTYLSLSTWPQAVAVGNQSPKQACCSGGERLEPNQTNMADRGVLVISLF